MQTNPWLLPEGVQEVLPPESWRLETARRALLDLYWRWGYELIRPPLIEYLDSLLTGAGHDLDLQTFKLVDQLNGRTMGVRSDMTTQAARIDAHRATRQGTARYCYIGSILRARPEEPGGSRSPLQLGVEMFGADSIRGDMEIVSLMLETLALMGVDNATLDLGHVEIYRALVRHCEVSAALEPQLFEIVQRKSLPDLQTLHAAGQLDAVCYRHFADLIELNGCAEVLDDASARLGGIAPDIDAALTSLRTMVALLHLHYPQTDVVLDLSELRGYRYKTGLLYAAFAPGAGRELARGGRYDDVGAVFGRGRAATGFSADLNLLTELGRYENRQQGDSIFAPADDDPQLLAEIRALRHSGERVVIGLAADDTAQAQGCRRELNNTTGSWQLHEL